MSSDFDEVREGYLERLSQARELADKGLVNEASAIYDEVSEGLAGADDPYLRHLASFALRAKARRLGEAGRFNEELAAVSLLQLRYGEAKEPEVILNVARALTQRAYSLIGRRKYRRALQSADDALALCLGSDDPSLRATAATAFLYRSSALGKLLRIRRQMRNNTALFKFMGPNPEPEVLDAVRTVGRERALRAWRLYHAAHR